MRPCLDRDRRPRSEAHPPVRDLVEEVGADADADELVAAAESAFRANWRLLDGV